MNNICLKIAVAMIAVLTIAANANAVTRTVDCDKGQTIQDALEKGKGSAEPLLIYAYGTCEQDVSIERDDVTIHGSNSASIAGTIRVHGGRRIDIKDITLTGPGLGIDVFGGDVELRNVIVTGNESTAGVASNLNAYVGIFDSTISNNSENGVLALQGSSILVRDSTISGNTLDGIAAINGATATVENVTISGNERGILAFTNANVIVKDSDIVSNLGSGVEASNGSTILIQDTTNISSNVRSGIDVFLHSNVLILNSSVTNNSGTGISLKNDSGIHTDSTVTVSGNVGNAVFCADTESSFSSDSQSIVGNITCTGYDQVAPPAP